MPMISAMMVMTTSNSTSVKPRWLRGARRCFLSHVAMRRMPLPDDLADREERRHYRHDQPADDDADRDDGRRPGDSDDAIEAALQLRLVELRDAPGEHRQLA